MKEMYRKLIEYMDKEISELKDRLYEFEKAKKFERVASDFIPENKVYMLQASPFEFGATYLADGYLYKVVETNRNDETIKLKLVN